MGNPVNGLWGSEFFGGPTPTTPVVDPTLVGMVRTLIDQTHGDVFWPSQQLYDAANEVITDFWLAGNRSGEYIQLASAPFIVTQGADIVSYSTTSLMVPQYWILNTSTANSTINQTYWISDRSQLERWSRYWRSNEQSQPRWLIMFDNFNLRVFPSPDQTYTFTLVGIPWPNEISSTQEDLIVNVAGADRMFKLAMAYKIAASLLLYTRSDVAAQYTKMSDECLYYFRKRLRSQANPKIHRLLPGVGSRQSDVNIGATKGVLAIGRRLS